MLQDVLNRFNRLFEVDQSELDPVKQAQNRFYFNIIKMLYYYVLGLFVATIFIFIQKLIAFVVLTVFLSLLILSHRSALKGNMKKAGQIITWSHFIMIGAVLVFSGKNSSHYFVWLLLVPILAGMLLNKKSSYFFGVLISIVYASIQLLGEYNLYLPVIFPAPVFPRIAVMTVVIIFIVVLINEAGDSLKKAILKGSEEIEVRKQAEIKARESALLKENILNNMSHEFRTPLTGILGISEILSDSDQPEFQKMGNELKISGKRLLNTLNQLLQTADVFSMIESKENRTFDLVELINECLNSRKETVRQTENKIVFLTDEKSLFIHSHPEAIKEILSRLVENAVKFTRNGVIEIILLNNPESNIVSISVKDTGIGIAHEHLETIFEEFKQVSTGMGRGFEGVGLGLSIVKRLISKLEGEIIVESEVGKGSQFTVLLPLK